MNGMVYIVDDDQGVRDSLAMLLRSTEIDCRTFGAARPFLEDCARDEGPACLLLDVNMPDMSGFECQRVLRERDLRMPVIFLTGYADVPGAVTAMKRGAMDYLEKPLQDSERFLERVKEALERDTRRLQQRKRRESVCARLGRLTPREREIAGLVVAGRANKVIATDLGISERTVEVHRSRAFDKLDVHHVAELVHLMNIAKDSDRTTFP